MPALLRVSQATCCPGGQEDLGQGIPGETETGCVRMAGLSVAVRELGAMHAL